MGAQTSTVFGLLERPGRERGLGGRRGLAGLNVQRL
jgi:hypothetical protein